MSLRDISSRAWASTYRVGRPRAGGDSGPQFWTCFPSNILLRALLSCCPGTGHALGALQLPRWPCWAPAATFSSESWYLGVDFLPRTPPLGPRNTSPAQAACQQKQWPNGAHQLEGSFPFVSHLGSRPNSLLSFYGPSPPAPAFMISFPVTGNS